MKKNDLQHPFDIGVVIVTFNSHPIIRDCLVHLKTALQSSTGQVVIVDNLSTDGTREWLLNGARSALGPKVQLQVILNSENCGFTRAVNQGLRRLSADFVLLLNPDVLLQPETLAILLRRLQDPRVGIVAPQMRYFDGRIQPSCRRFPRKTDVIFELIGLSRLFPTHPRFNRWKMGDFDHTFSRRVDQPQGAFLLFSHRLPTRLGLLDESFVMFFSDVEWCRRVVRNGYQIHFCAETFVLHKKGDSIYRDRARMIASSHAGFARYLLSEARTGAEKFGTGIVTLLLLITAWIRIPWAIAAGQRPQF
ncbi:glycosyltransferase family 2 protein [candidate division KSB1 bacterium]|nr:glycosyltransferase family 2 protein [candidate division KSB1 bacterium]